jgi:farnesyl diphosphate synthase
MTVAIPVAVAAAALIPLWPILDRVAAAFFAELTLVQQGSVLALIFAVIFASLATASSLKSTESPMVPPRPSTNANIGHSNYPLKQVQAATTDLDKFKCLFPMLKDEILVHLQTQHELCDEAVDWVDKMLEYSVPGGKLNRGTTVLAVVRTLLQRELTPVETCRAAILGWTIEFLQAFFLVADDVMDDSQTRRGQPCWYKLPKVGLIAINDAFLLESFVFTILKNHFGTEPFYAAVLDLLIDVTQRTEVGQLLDLTSQEMGGTMDLNRFTEERYKSIVKYKTAFYSFYLPVAMGMHMVMGDKLAATDSPALDQARSICCAMGEYFQIQDDYLDCFGDPETIGKIGTDIQDKKCSWLAVQALKRCRGPDDRRLLEENYGVWDDVKVARVKQLFRDLGLVQAFEDYEEESYRQISAEIAQVKLVPKEVYELFLHKIYKRSK